MPSKPTGKPPVEPKRKRIKRVERSLVFKPETLRTAEDVDRYLGEVRDALLRDLDGTDGIRIQ